MSELRETHGSWVLLGREAVLKVKKPVRFPFMDYGTVEARRAACEEEVRVNRDLADGIYVGVDPLVTRAGEVIDHAVRMRRFDEASTMASLARSGRLRATHVAAVAWRLAAFHARATPSFAADPLAAWRGRVEADLAELDRLGAEATAHRAFARGAASRMAAVLAGRARRGLVRDGHGDLRAEHVLLRSPPAIVDRIEFDPALRTTDVADDLAFLAMDLEHLGARWAADVLLDSYAAAGGDVAPAALAALFAWHRAIVRIKVALLSDAPGDALALGSLADRLAWRARAPWTLAVIGPPASGKSTLARHLGDLLEVPVLASDALRRRMHHLTGTQRGHPALYTPQARAAVYEELSHAAARTAPTSGGVVVEATFAEPAHRRRLVAALGDVTWIECCAPAQLRERRAAERERDPRRASDAGPEVARALAARFAPTEGLGSVVRVPTDGGIEAALAVVAAWRDVRPAGPPHR